MRDGDLRPLIPRYNNIPAITTTEIGRPFYEILDQLIIYIHERQ